MKKYLSIDETALSGGELYTIVTNKAAKGRKGSIASMLKRTQAEPDYCHLRTYTITAAK